MTELLGRTKRCTVKPSRLGDEHTLDLLRIGCRRTDAVARGAMKRGPERRARSLSFRAAEPTAAAAMVRRALIMSWMGERVIRRPPQDGRPAPRLPLVIGLAAVDKCKRFPRAPKDVSAAEVEVRVFAKDARSVHELGLGSAPLSLRVSSAAMTKREDFANCCILCGLTFELSWHRRRGAVDSKRKMGRRPSA